MSTNVVYERISLWRTAWAEMEATKKVWWPWVAGFVILYVAVVMTIQYLVPLTDLDRTALKQHPEMMFKFFKPLIPLLLAIACLYIAATWTFAMIYLRHAVKNGPPVLSVNNFFFWLGRVTLKYLCPVPWLLLAPVLGIGLIFYYRSIFRRVVVTPLAILQREPVLQTSWDLTKGHVWRIIWGSLVLNLLLLLIIFGIILIPAIAWAMMTHGDRHSIFYTGGYALFRGASTGITLMANAIYSCTVYRVLLREQKTAAPNDPLSF